MLGETLDALIDELSAIIKAGEIIPLQDNHVSQD